MSDDWKTVTPEDVVASEAAWRRRNLEDLVAHSRLVIASAEADLATLDEWAAERLALIRRDLLLTASVATMN